MLNWGITTKKQKAALLPSAGEPRDCDTAADDELDASNLKMVLGFY